MEFLNRTTKSTDPQKALDELSKDCAASYDLGIIFISQQDPHVIEDLVTRLRKKIQF